jgi:anthranilate phosphoribosyltransferase
VPKAAAGALKGGEAPANAAIIRRILDGVQGPQRDVVLLNSGAALLVAGAASSVRDGVARAAQAIDRGDSKRTLERMIAVSTAGESAATSS